MTILYERPEADRWAGTPHEQKPMPPDHEITAAIQRVYREGSDLRRVAWELGDLDVEALSQWVQVRPALREAHRRYFWGVVE